MYVVENKSHTITHVYTTILRQIERCLWFTLCITEWMNYEWRPDMIAFYEDVVYGTPEI